MKSLLYTQLNAAQRAAVDEWEESQEEAFECQDTFRYADSENQEQIDAYENIKNGGCCAFVDVELKCSDGTILWYGFNYGH